MELLANSLKVKVGQQIPVRTPSGSVKLTVIGVLRGAGLSMASISGVRMPQSGFVSLRTGSTFFLQSAGVPKAMLFYVKLRAGSDVTLIKNKIHQRLGTTYELEMITVNDLMTEVETYSNSTI